MESNEILEKNDLQTIHHFARDKSNHLTICSWLGSWLGETSQGGLCFGFDFKLSGLQRVQQSLDSAALLLKILNTF